MPKTATPAAKTDDELLSLLSLELLDPAEIIVKNVRKAKPDKDLIESVRANGVRSPIGVLRTEDGKLHLRFGDRRRQACITAKRRVLALVVDGTAGSDQDEIERIFEQLDENDNRQALTAGERAAAVQTLFDYGVDEAAVAARTTIRKEQIAAARQVAASKTAQTLAGKHSLNLEQSAAVAEFDGDKAAQKQLVDAAAEGPVRFQHALQRLRHEKATNEAIAARVAELTEQGFTIAPKDLVLSWENGIEEWDDEAGKRFTQKTHKACPGNVVRVSSGYSSHGVNVRESWYCADPKANGHRKHRMSTDGVLGKSKEEASAERKKVLAGNKLWREAEGVRRTWLREFLSRPKAPDDALVFVLEAVAASDRRLMDYGMEHRSDGGRHGSARALLGLPKSERSGWNAVPEVYTAMKQAGRDRALMIGLGIVLGAFEASTGVHTWRHNSPDGAAYLEKLASWGYQLSDFEAEFVATTRAAEAAAQAKKDEAAALREQAAEPATDDDQHPDDDQADDDEEFGDDETDDGWDDETGDEDD